MPRKFGVAHGAVLRLTERHGSLVGTSKFFARPPARSLSDACCLKCTEFHLFWNHESVRHVVNNACSWSLEGRSSCREVLLAFLLPQWARGNLLAVMMPVPKARKVWSNRCDLPRPRFATSWPTGCFVRNEGDRFQEIYTYIFMNTYAVYLLAAWWSKFHQGTFNVLWSRFKSTVLPVGGVGKYMSKRFGNQVMFLEISPSCCQHVEVTFYKKIFTWQLAAWQAKELQFAAWIEANFPADPAKLGCLLRCPVVLEESELMRFSLQVVGHLHNSPPELFWVHKNSLFLAAVWIGIARFNWCSEDSLFRDNWARAMLLAAMATRVQRRLRVFRAFVSLMKPSCFCNWLYQRGSHPSFRNHFAGLVFRFAS